MNNTFTVTPMFQVPFPVKCLPSSDGSLFGSVAIEFSFNYIGSYMAVILKHSPCVTWLLNVRNRSFDLISDYTLEYFGYKLLHYAVRSHQFHEIIMLPDNTANIAKLNSCISKRLSQVTPESRSGYKFSYDYRIVKPNGKMARLLEQNTILRQDSHGNTTHLLGSYTDISLEKLDNSLHRLFRRTKNNISCSPPKPPS